MEVFLVPIYMVERDLPGVTVEDLAAAQKRVIEMGKELTAQGKQVRRLFRGKTSVCVCLKHPIPRM